MLLRRPDSDHSLTVWEMGLLEVEGHCRVLGGVVGAVVTTLCGHHNRHLRR